jgi:hypothetical protein
MTRSQPEPSSGGAPPWGPRRYAADRDREVERPRSAAALPPGGTAASPLAELTSWSAKQRRADAALIPCRNRVEKGPLEISAMASGAGRRLRRDSCFQALAGERPRRRWKEVHPLLDPAAVPGSHAPSGDGIDQVRSRRGSVPTIWLHAASTGWALPQRRNRAWPRLTMAREGWRSPNLREVCVRAQPLVRARAWLGGEGLFGGEARCFAHHYGDVANAPPRRSLTSQERATTSRTRRDDRRTRRARGADPNALKEHPFSNQRFSTSFVWPLKATTQPSQEPRNQNLKMTNQTR